jgi:flagellar assembly protein FliH
MRLFPERRPRVIKAQQLVQKGPGAPLRSPAAMGPARADSASTADHIIQVARQVARATLSIAQRDADHLRRQAEREAKRHGFEAGRKAGYAEGLRAAEQDAQRIIAQSEASAKEVLSRAEAEIGQLACEVAAHLLGVQLMLNPEVVERAVLEVLQEAPQKGPVSIEVSPVDLERALKALPAFRGAVGSGAEVTLQEDPSLPQGGLRVSGPQGVVERNWHEGLVAISQAFEEVAHRGI